jgi:hypothetical protein
VTATIGSIAVGTEVEVLSEMMTAPQDIGCETTTFGGLRNLNCPRQTGAQSTTGSGLAISVAALLYPKSTRA